jgi:hypothetical protein
MHILAFCKGTGLSEAQFVMHTMILWLSTVMSAYEYLSLWIAFGAAQYRNVLLTHY